MCEKSSQNSIQQSNKTGVYETRLGCEIYTAYEHDNGTKACGMYNKVQAFNL